MVNSTKSHTAVGRAVCLASALFGSVAAACAGTDVPPVPEGYDGLISVGGGPPTGTSQAPNAAFTTPPVADQSSGGATSATPSSVAAGGSAGVGGGAGAAGAPMMKKEIEPPCNGLPILQENCAMAACHGEGSLLGEFADNEAQAIALVGEPMISPNSGPDCPLPYFDPANPERSGVIARLQGSPEVPGCNQGMPIGGALSEAEVACLTDWIGSLQ